MLPQSTRTLSLFAEVVPDDTSSWRQSVRFGRVWKRRPDSGWKGRLVHLRVRIPAGFLIAETSVEVELVDDVEPVCGAGEVVG